jgi:hypothetical protein
MSLVDLEGASGDYADCRLLRWDEVESHTKKCFYSLRMDVLVLNLNAQGVTKLERVEALESVVHVLIFEMALGKAAPWDSHLPPAFALLREIMDCDGSARHEQVHFKLTSALFKMSGWNARDKR